MGVMGFADSTTSPTVVSKKAEKLTLPDDDAEQLTPAQSFFQPLVKFFQSNSDFQPCELMYFCRESSFELLAKSR
jgi:hypothetical protein